MSEAVMKRTRRKGKTSMRANSDEILPEYDFTRASRNKYASDTLPGVL
jgi:hypothetical protein